MHKLKKLRKLFSKTKANVSEYVPESSHYTFERGTRIYTEAFEKGIEFAQMNRVYGDIIEFGTFMGFTAAIFAKLIKQYNFNASLHLLDSFEGLPEITSKVDLESYEGKELQVWTSGAMAVEEQIPTLIQKKLETIIRPEHFSIYKGFYSETFQKDTFKNKPSIVHMDCDLYQSSKEVLSKLFAYDLVQDGMLIFFDDYNCGRANPNFGQRKAFKEIMDENPSYSHSLFYYYGWHGAAMIIHENKEY